MASVQFINYLTAFGLPELLSRHRPAAHRPDTLFTLSATLTSLGSAAGCLLYPIVVSSPSTSLLRAEGLVGLVVFYLCATGAAIGLLADVRLMSQRRWHLVLARLGISSVVRLPLLLAGPGPFDPALWLFVVSAGPLALSAVPAAVVALRHHGPGWTLASLGTAPGPALRYAALNHAAHLAMFAPQFVLPVIVLANVSAVENATFYVAWNITAVIMVLPVTVGRVLLLEGSRALEQLWPTTRAALVIAIVAVTAALMGCIAFRWVIPVVYGSDYRAAATLVVPLVAGAIPWSLTSVALGTFRVCADGQRLLITAAVLASAVLGLAALTVRTGGTAAAAVAWLTGNAMAAAVAGGLLLTRWRSEHELGATLDADHQPPRTDTHSGEAAAT
jgi:O-antigen/teichoic acid export membrane protein